VTEIEMLPFTFYATNKIVFNQTQGI
jgi:hypothetical protein